MSCLTGRLRSCGWACVLIAAISGLGSPALAWDSAAFNEALELIEDGRYQEAVEALTPIVDENQERVALHRLMGTLYLQLSDLDKAEYFMQRAVNLDPQDADAQYDLAVLYYRQMRHSQAIRVLDRAERLVSKEDRARIWRLRGNAYAAQRKWGAAIRDLRRAMELDPDAGSLVQLARAYLGTGKDRKAIEACRQAYGLDPARGEAYRLASAALVRIAQKTRGAEKKRELYDEALTEAEGLLAAEPMSWTTWYQAGRAALGARKLDKAEDYLRQVVAERPDYCNVWFNLAQIYETQERWYEAGEAMDEAHACAPHLTPMLDLDRLDEFDPLAPFANREL